MALPDKAFLILFFRICRPQQSHTNATQTRLHVVVHITTISLFCVIQTPDQLLVSRCKLFKKEASQLSHRSETFSSTGLLRSQIWSLCDLASGTSFSSNQPQVLRKKTSLTTFTFDLADHDKSSNP